MSCYVTGICIMTTRQMYYHANRIKEIVKQHGKIHKFDLVEQARISLSSYEKLKPWIEYRFGDFVSYNKMTKEWVADE